jgi:hypothetical protein
MIASRIDDLPGWRTLNDVETAIGIVPLVAVGPAGVFAIDLWAVDAPCALADVPERGLIHAWAQAKHLERRRVGSPVTPVLVLDVLVPGRRRGVQVLSPDALGTWLSRLPAMLDARQTELVLSRLQDAPQSLLLVA